MTQVHARFGGGEYLELVSSNHCSRDNFDELGKAVSGTHHEFMQLNVDTLCSRETRVLPNDTSDYGNDVFCVS